MSAVGKFVPLITLMITIISVTQSERSRRVINHGSIVPKIAISSKTQTNSDESVIIHLGNWTLKMQLNDYIFRGVDVYHVDSRPTGSSGVEKNVECQRLRGRVKNVKKSVAIVTICGQNFYIFLNIRERTFAVEPRENGHFLEELIWAEGRTKRAVGEGFWNLTGDTFGIGEIGDSEDFFEGNGENLFSSHMWTRKDTWNHGNGTFTHDLGQRWLELGVAVDYSVVEFHGDRVQQYVLALLNIVGAIYKDPSLGPHLTLVVVKIFLYVNKKDGMVRQGNARTSLENVNKWNRKILASLRPQGHDVAVWLTRLDIGGPSGYAPVAGACDPARSCALNRDEGLTSAFIIAHELAHILGLTHDGDTAADNSCGTEATKGSVMAPMVAATFHRFHWSPCSRREFNEKARLWTCLNNPPNIGDATHLKPPPHETFTMDEQCRMEFGNGYTLCTSRELPGLCSHLWCAHKTTPKICKTKKGPPLEGTACGQGKWCISGLCESIDRAKFAMDQVTMQPRDGGWSTWSPWGKCSRSCGVAVRHRHRLCNHPAPASGGLDCTGNGQEFQICKQPKCPLGTDFRREQCWRLPDVASLERSLENHRITLIPHETDKDNDKCQLSCRSYRTNEIYRSADFFIDGTPCSHGSQDICIQGKCHKMGCDGILNSPYNFDACGVCRGDNSTCIIISNKFHRKIRRVTTRAAVIPRNSYDINLDVGLVVHSRANETIRILIRDRHKKKHEFLSESLLVEGALFELQKFENRVIIGGKGPTIAAVIISLVLPEAAVRGSSISVSLKYLTNGEDEERIDKYSWLPGVWGPCSVSCGRGVRRRTSTCRNDENGRIVHKKRCYSRENSNAEVEECNVFSCEFKWIPGPWEGCTRTCGARGVQQRQLYCVHSSFPLEYLSKSDEVRVFGVMLPPNLCKEHFQPDKQQNCNRVPCRGTWVFTDWSSCSQSCGRGVQSRMGRCIPPDGETLFNCTGPHTAGELRPCRGLARPNAGCEAFCKRDKSRYCHVPNLTKYCANAEFRRHCCLSCMNIVPP